MTSGRRTWSGLGLVLLLVGCGARALDTPTGDEPPADLEGPVCPASLPRDGSPCTHERPEGLTPGGQCAYDTPCGRVGATCSGGHWGVWPEVDPRCRG